MAAYKVRGRVRVKVRVRVRVQQAENTLAASKASQIDRSIDR